MALHIDMLPLLSDTPGLEGVIRTIDWSDGELSGIELPLMNDDYGTAAVRDLVVEEIASLSDEELNDGFTISAPFCLTSADETPGMYFAFPNEISVDGRPFGLSTDEWRRIVCKAVRAGCPDREDRYRINIDDRVLTVFTEEILHAQECQEFDEELCFIADEDWPEPFAAAKDKWKGREAELLLKLRSLIGDDDPRIMKSLSLIALLSLIDILEDIERFLPAVQAGPQEVVRMPRLYAVNAGAWKRWAESPSKLRDGRTRLIRLIGVRDLVGIFQYKAAFFGRKRGEARFEAVMADGHWATDQEKRQLLRRLDHVAFDAVSGELLLDEEPTAPEKVFEGVMSGNMTKADVPEWLMQSRRDRAKLQAKRKARKEARAKQNAAIVS